MEGKQRLYKRIGLLVSVAVLILGGCESADTLMNVGDVDYTKDSYIEMLEDVVDVEDRRELFLEKITKSLVGTKEAEQVYQEGLRYMEQFARVDESLEKDTLEKLREQAGMIAGVIAVYLNAGIVTEEEINEEYGEGKNLYTIQAVTLEEGTDKVEEITRLLTGSKDLKQDLGNFGEGITYNEKITFNEYEVPSEFEQIRTKEVGYIGVEEVEGVTFVYKVEDVQKAEMDVVRNDIVLALGNAKGLDSIYILDKLEKQGVITISKKMREYLELDADKVK